MPDKHHDKRFPGESDGYREARDNLLEAELQLRHQIENVAALRRQLPRGGAINEDYTFDEIVDGEVRQVRMSELFEDGKHTLVVYSFMYGPDMEKPCPSCTSIIDGLNGQVRHITQRANLVVVGKSPVQRLQAWADNRGWDTARLLSSAANSYNADYFAETDGGAQLPACNVFVKRDDGIFHTYSTEALYVKQDGHPRHVDSLWPLWNVLDLTPEGRADFNPSLSYE